MSILRRIFPFLLTAALLCACVQMPNTPQDVLPAPTPQPTAAPAATPKRNASSNETPRSKPISTPPSIASPAPTVELAVTGRAGENSVR